MHYKIQWERYKAASTRADDAARGFRAPLAVGHGGNGSMQAGTYTLAWPIGVGCIGMHVIRMHGTSCDQHVLLLGVACHRAGVASFERELDRQYSDLHYEVDRIRKK
jgi:hypothetical protein